MSTYPEWWDTTITLYNKYTDPQTQVVRWFGHVITGCFVDKTPSMAVAGNVLAQSNDIICRIRERNDYRSKVEWVQLFNDQLGDYLTISQGDIVVFGEIDDVIDEDVRGHRAADLISKYKDLQGAIFVKRYSENVGAGRCMPHYYLAGE